MRHLLLCSTDELRLMEEAIDSLTIQKGRSLLPGDIAKVTSLLKLKAKVFCKRLGRSSSGSSAPTGQLF